MGEDFRGRASRILHIGRRAGGGGSDEPTRIRWE